MAATGPYILESINEKNGARIEPGNFEAVFNLFEPWRHAIPTAIGLQASAAAKFRFLTTHSKALAEAADLLIVFPVRALASGHRLWQVAGKSEIGHRGTARLMPQPNE